jgi:alkylresorcinol/alkylpyrone synthase
VTEILAVSTAFPAHKHPQGQLTAKYADLAGLRRARRTLLERLHQNAGVRTRHTVAPLHEYGTLGGIASRNDRYIAEATALGERALTQALTRAGREPPDIDLLVVTSVTGVAVPSIDARLIPRLGLRPDVKRLPIFGLGCVAGAAALSRVHDYLHGWPGHTAALLAVELCSLTVPAAGATTADLVASGLFGDGAAALIASGTRAPGQPGGPRVIATRGEVFPDSTDALGWRLSEGGFRIVLTTDLSEVVESRLGSAITQFLAERGLTADDIGAWICHPGGPRVIDAVQRALKLPDEAVAPSREALAEAGNLSSASVLHILEKVGDAGVTPGTFGLMIGLGPGVSAELVLLRW